MGDRRYEHPYERVRDARDREWVLRRMSDEDIIEALAAASRVHDPFLANVLATSALNRVRRLRAALAHLGDGVVALGPRGEVLWSNPAADKMLGWRREEVLGLPFEDSVEHRDASEEPVPADACRLLRTALTGEPARADGDTFRVPGRPPVRVEYTTAPMRGADGEVEGAVIAFRDCSERKRAERDLQVSRQRYKSLFDELPDGIISIALDGTIIDSNAAAEAMTGRPTEEARGRPFTDFLREDDLPHALKLFDRVLHGQRERTRLRVLHNAGHFVECDALGVPVVVDGEVVGVHGIVRPVE